MARADRSGPRDRPPWSWPGFVATILALCVGGGFAAAMLGATLQHEPVTQQGAALLNTLGGGLIAVLSLWIGGQAESARHEREVELMTTTTPDEIPEQPQHPDVEPVVEPVEPVVDPGGHDDATSDDTPRVR